MKVIVNYDDKRWKNYNIDYDNIVNTVNSSKESEVSIILTCDKEIRQLNKKYRKIDKPTNVLSFETGDNYLLGDIFISFETVKKQAKKENKSFEDHATHLVIHGLLHLMGFDHIEEKQAQEMENLEILNLKKLGIKNPYEDETILNLFFKNNIIRIFIFIIAGIFASLGFAPYNLFFISIIGFALVYFYSIRNIEKKLSIFHLLKFIFPFSSIYSVSMFGWVVNSIYVVPELSEQFAVWTIPILISIGLFGGIFFSIPYICIMCISCKSIYRPVLFSLFITLSLWFREWIFTGLPWNPLSNIFINYSLIFNSISFWGSLGLTFVISGLISSFIEIFTDYKNKFNYINFLFFILLSFIGCLFGFYNIKKSNLDNNKSIVIRLVQPATIQSEKSVFFKDSITEAKDKINNLIKLSTNNITNIDLIIFPETTYPFVITENSNFDFTKNLNKKIIIGSLSYDNNKLYNSLLLINEKGELEKIYNKSHLVPFGEYSPFGNLIPSPGILSKGIGTEIISTKVSNKSLSFIPAICYEIIFSNSLNSKNKITSPDLIINITNDTWFGKTKGTYQHLDMVRRYAVESGLPIARSNYSGISAFIAPDGKIISSLNIGERGFLDGSFYGAHETIYRIVGRDWWMIIILIYSLIYSGSIFLLQKKD